MKRYHDIGDPTIVKMMAHPLRIKILRYLEDHVASPSQLADEFGVVVGTASYHVRVLHKFGLIELVRQIPRRGAIEHFYRAPEHIWFSDETWASLPKVVRGAMSETLLTDIGERVGAAASLGHLDSEDAYVGRNTYMFTEEVRATLNDRLIALRDELLTLEAKCVAKLKARDHAGERPTTLVTLLFDPAPEFSAPDSGVHSDTSETKDSAGPTMPKSQVLRPGSSRRQRRDER